MRPLPWLAGGLVAGVVIVMGEAVLNVLLLGDAWAAIFARFSLPPPGPAVAAQGVFKLLLLGAFSVWLASVFRAAFGSPDRAAICAGLVIWLLVWAWVQWGMLLAGYVTAPIALLTVAWGLPELPLAAWAGFSVYRKLSCRTLTVD